LTRSDAPVYNAGPAGQPLITLENVTLCSHGVTMFEGTDWQIGANELWALVGPNGSGKSTLARALCGRVPVIAGQITYHYSDHGIAPHKHVALISFHSQHDAVLSRAGFHQARWNVGAVERSRPVAQYLSAEAVQHRNPFAIVAERPDSASFSAHRQRTIERLQIGDLLEKDLIQLSSGERRKVSIARALLARPRVLILENPFTGLDTASREMLGRAIGQLAREQVSVILVSPRLEEIPPHASHILLVREGRVIAQGLRERVLATAEPPPAPGTRQFHLPPSRVQRERSQATLVQMRGVRVQYGERQILDGVDWTVRQGEHWALLGPNGAGKTTLLSLILGDHPQAYANEIVLFGRRRGSGESIWQVKSQIGWVAPELHLYYPQRSSCLDVVCSGFSDTIGLRGPCPAEQRTAAERWMAALGIGELAGRHFGELSEGQQRLALVARALVKVPPLLILDEPCQGLDAPNRVRLHHLVEATARRSPTSVIYVTHEAHELPSIITHVLRLDAGRATYCGPIDRDPLLGASTRHELAAQGNVV
jgi:molybdate transport system ATP-binding protein